ncbi:hypothetical protein G9A89_010703 [Geosiphon pyriformis]|nr:hypothetical protein G9A89_010703 [Geosiphon pyriformis]
MNSDSEQTQEPVEGEDNPFLASSSPLPSVTQLEETSFTETTTFRSASWIRPSKRTRRESAEGFSVGALGTPSSFTTPLSLGSFSFSPSTVRSAYTGLTRESFDLKPQNEKLNEELNEARSKIHDLERQLSAKEFEFEFDARKLERAHQSLKIQLQEIELERERLEKDNQFLREQERVALESRQASEETLCKTREESIVLKKQLSEENRNLSQKYSELQYLKEQVERESTRKIEELNRKISVLERSLNQANYKFESQERLSISRQDLLLKLQNQLLEKDQLLSRYNIAVSEVEAIESLRNKYEAQQNLAVSLQEQLRKEREQSPLVVELCLKNELLRRQVEDLSRLTEITATLQTEKAKLEKEHVLWSSVLEKDKLGSPYKVSEDVKKYRIQIEGLEGKISIYQEFMDRKNSVIDTLEEKIRDLTNQSAQLSQTVDQYGVVIEQLKNRVHNEASKILEHLKRRPAPTVKPDPNNTLSIPGQPTDSDALKNETNAIKNEVANLLRELYRNYTRQLDIGLQSIKALSPPLKDQKDLVHIESQSVETRQEYIVFQNELEKFQKENASLKMNLADSRRQLEILERSAQRVQESVNEASKVREILHKANKELLIENEQLRSTISSLEREVSNLEMTLGRGEFNYNVNRVLQHKENPESQLFTVRQATLDALRMENRQLIEILKHGVSLVPKDRENDENLADNGSNTVSEKRLDDIIPKQSFLNLETENKRLQELIAEKDERTARLKEAFKSKAQEFREAVHNLLGYRVDFLENSRVRLTSIYSEQEDHSFLFTSDEENFGKMRLSGGGNTEYINSISNLIQFWLNDRDSIPGFMSSLTLELFEKTTVGQNAGWVERDLNTPMDDDMSVTTSALSMNPTTE